jgi:hypothetical protein
MSNFPEKSPKFFDLKPKKCFFKLNNSFKKNFNVYLLDEINISNKSKILFGPRYNFTNIQRTISSKVVILSFKKSLLQFWETYSGRLIRSIGVFPVYPKKTFINYNFNIIGIFTKKNLLIFELSTSFLLHSLSIRSPHPIRFQLIQNVPLVILINTFNKVQIIDYRKGCILKTLDLKNNNLFLDGINYDTIEYFSKNIISLNILHLSKPKFNKLNFTQNANSDEKKIKIQEVSINILPTSIFYSNILLILNRNYYLWDRNTRLVILN